MNQKQQILKLIEDEKIRLCKSEKTIFNKYFTTKGDKRWFDGIRFALENIEDLINTEIKTTNL
jgi:hypothetical protein